MYPLGDLHVGHEEADYEAMKLTVKAIECDPNARVVLMGDLMETDIPTHLPQAMWQQKITPEDQIEYLVELLSPIAEKIVFAMSGNHENRLINKTSLDPTKIILRRLLLDPDKLYRKRGGLFDLTVGKKKWVVFATHGSGSSQRGRYQLEKAMRVFDADLYLIAHIHKIDYLRLERIGLRGRLVKYGVRTGGFLRYPDYAFERLYTPCDIGTPIIHLDEKRIVIDEDSLRFNDGSG